VLLLLIQVSCSYKKEQKNSPASKEATTIAISKNNKPLEKLSKSDSVYIKTARGELYKFERTTFNDIVKKHPEFSEQPPKNPTLLYQKNNDFENFGSEVGQDLYFILYAHFQKKQHGKGIADRKKLIEIYTKINSIFQQLQHGGTYFGHQYSRILGTIEYELHRVSANKKDTNRTVKFDKQKKQYIASLRQLINTKIKADTEISKTHDKLLIKNRLNTVVDTLDNLISNAFYLRSTQKFQYEYYDFESKN
jgi:hypothetical protein